GSGLARRRPHQPAVEHGPGAPDQSVSAQRRTGGEGATRRLAQRHALRSVRQFARVERPLLKMGAKSPKFGENLTTYALVPRIPDLEAWSSPPANVVAKQKNHDSRRFGTSCESLRRGCRRGPRGLPEPRRLRRGAHRQ